MNKQTYNGHYVEVPLSQSTDSVLSDSFNRPTIVVKNGEGFTLDVVDEEDVLIARINVFSNTIRNWADIDVIPGEYRKAYVLSWDNGEQALNKPIKEGGLVSIDLQSKKTEKE